MKSMNLRDSFEIYKSLKRGDAQISLSEHEPVDLVVIPESSSDFVMSLARQMGSSVAQLKKRPVPELIKLVLEQKMQKLEKEKLLATLSTLDHLAMHKIAGNQRWRFEKILFYPMNVDKCGRVLLLDDSSFSGSTMRAMKHAVSRYDDVFIAFRYF